MRLVPRALPKFHGLKLIELHGLPHPDWRFVSTHMPAAASPWTSAPDGWTIRCAPTKFYATGLPSRHRLRFVDISAALASFAKAANSVDAFVVYPSWEFDRSGCVLIQGDRLMIEAVRGDIAPLLAGSRTPDCTMAFSRTFGPTRFDDDKGRGALLHPNELRCIWKAMRRIESADVTLEWTITQRGALYFHDWLELLPA